MTDRLILTMASGKLCGDMADVSVPYMDLYARRVGADLRVVREPRPHPEVEPFTAVQLAKLDAVHEALGDYRRVLWLDVDVMVRPDSPDVFGVVPDGTWAGVDECSLARMRGWERHVYDVHQHMLKVCLLEGLPVPDSQARYFNCGVQLASRAVRDLYLPARRPDNFGWAEQSLINVRLFLNPEKYPIYYLPCAFNQMMWLDLPNYWRSSWFVHYCGVTADRRLPLMAADGTRWFDHYRPD